jgi:hypothetical protein
MARTLQYYRDKVTSEHHEQPNFMLTLDAVVQPLIDTQLVIESLSSDEFDLDLVLIPNPPDPDIRIGAEGVQLDAVGVRVNRDRYLSLAAGATAMTDAQYRHVLRATIQANKWDGTIPGADACYTLLFSVAPPAEPQFVVIQDSGNMTMALALFGAVPAAGALFSAEEVITLFQIDHLKLKPAGIKCFYLMRDGTWPLGEGAGGPPAFGVGADNANIRGVGQGYLLGVVRVE